MATRSTIPPTVTAAVCAPSETLAGLPVANDCGVPVHAPGPWFATGPGAFALLEVGM